MKQTVFDPSFTLWSYELLFFVLCHIYFSHIFLDFYLPFLFGVLFPFFWGLLFPFSLWTFISIFFLGLLFSLWTFIQSGSHFGFLPNFYSEISSSLNLSNFAGWKNSLEFLWCRYRGSPTSALVRSPLVWFPLVPTLLVYDILIVLVELLCSV